MLKNAAKLNSGAKPDCAIVPAICEMPTGPDNSAACVPRIISYKPLSIAIIV